MSSRPAARRLNRRTFLAGGAAAAGVVGAGAVVLANRSGSRSGQPAATPPTRTPRPASPTPAPASTATPFPRGGIIRLAAPARFNFDTFDAQLTGEPSVIGVLGRTHSRLLQWADLRAPTLGPDLVARWEQPDTQTLILHLDPAARWSPAPGFPGRSVTSDDVVLHLLRALEIAKSGTAPLAQRYQDYATFDRVHSPAAGVVSIAFSSPILSFWRPWPASSPSSRPPKPSRLSKPPRPALTPRESSVLAPSASTAREMALSCSSPPPVATGPRSLSTSSMSANHSTSLLASPMTIWTRSSPATAVKPKRSVPPAWPRSTRASNVRW
ncbi:MAG: hypothetical protein M5U18_06010 [Dehalococcoidia bacterium]|nr:hypothetical protein [Dehalococcoidia bacterium]